MANYETDTTIDMMGIMIDLDEWLKQRKIGLHNAWVVFWWAFAMGLGATFARYGWVWDRAIGNALLTGGIAAIFMYMANVGIIDVMVAFGIGLNRSDFDSLERYVEDELEEDEEELEYQQQFVAPTPVNGDDPFRQPKFDHFTWYANLRKHIITVNDRHYLYIKDKARLEIPKMVKPKMVLMLAKSRYERKIEEVSGRSLEDAGFGHRRSTDVIYLINWLKDVGILEDGPNNTNVFSKVGNVIFAPPPHPKQAGSKLDQAGSPV